MTTNNRPTHYGFQPQKGFAFAAINLPNANSGKNATGI
jgi:hypothetical protein